MRFHSRSRLSPSQKVGIGVALVLAAVIAYFVYNDGLFLKLWVVVKNNTFFWITLALGVGYALWNRLRHPRQVTWLELPVQIVGTTLSVILFFAFFFYQTTDLQDREFLNGYVLRAEYEEGWMEETEHCTETCDSDGNNCRQTDCHWVCDRSHPPSWQVVHNTGERTSRTTSISSGDFERYARHFGNRRFVSQSHLHQCSSGDGNMYVSDYPRGKPELIVPSALNHQFVNYVKGTTSIRKRIGGNTKGFEPLLRPYPKLRNRGFGAIDIDRVINAGVDLPDGWMETVDRQLDVALSTLGGKKQVNILVYVVNTSDQAFLHALEEEWVNGKKNDVIVLIGAPERKIAWVSVMAWTDVEEFKIQLRDKVFALKTLDGNAEKLAKLITDQVALPPQQGGYERKPMDELEYLAGDVSLPWWSVIILFLINFLIAYAIGWALRNNEIRDPNVGSEEV